MLLIVVAEEKEAVPEVEVEAAVSEAAIIASAVFWRSQRVGHAAMDAEWALRQNQVEESLEQHVRHIPHIGRQSNLKNWQWLFLD